MNVFGDESMKISASGYASITYLIIKLPICSEINSRKKNRFLPQPRKAKPDRNRKMRQHFNPKISDFP